MKNLHGFALAGLLGLCAAQGSEAATATIDTATRYQTLEGFGAGSVYYTNWLPAHPNAQAIYDTMFTGLGLSYLRLGNWNQDTTNPLTADSTIVAEGRKRLGSRFKILMSSWSAPGWMKGSGSTKGSDANGTMYSKAKNTLKKTGSTYAYADFGHWWKRTLVRYATKGIVPTVISLQNEPDMNASYEETLFDAVQNDSIAGYPQALKAVHDSLATLQSPPKIYGPEVLGIGYGNFQKYADAMDRSLVDGYNYHLYHGSTGGAYIDPDGFNTILTTLSTKYTGKSWMMSEYCPMRSTHPASDMLTLAHLMINTLTKGNASSYINWELIWGDGGQMVQIDNPWTKKTWSVNPEYHGMRHFSKFTSPGWRRVSASSDDAKVRVVAFTSPAGDSTTLIALNLDTVNAKTLATGGKLVGTTDVWQSVAGGSYSKRLAALATNGTGSIALPAGSLTTVVWKKSVTTGIEVPAVGGEISLRRTASGLTLQTCLQGNGTLTLRNLAGRELARRPVPAGQAEIEFDLQVPHGVWLAEVRQGGTLKVARLAVP